MPISASSASEVSGGREHGNHSKLMSKARNIKDKYDMEMSNVQVPKPLVYMVTSAPWAPCFHDEKGVHIVSVVSG